MESKVSVIIPFYYGAQWLQSAIDSALKQTYGNLEIIVINDCSPEDISPIISQYRDRIVYIKHAINQGSGPARNTGISKATGDYIAFLDSDDVWEPSKIEKQISFMKLSGAHWCHTGYYHWNNETNVMREAKKNRDYGMVFPHILITMGILQSSVIISKSILDKDPNLRFNPSYKYGQDSELYSRISFNYPIAYIKEPLVKKRVTGYEIYRRARLRVHLHAGNYSYWKEYPYNGYFSRPKPLSAIGFIYYCYDKILPMKEDGCINLISKCLWTFPYFLERLYRIILDKRKPHDARYLKLD